MRSFLLLTAILVFPTLCFSQIPIDNRFILKGNIKGSDTGTLVLRYPDTLNKLIFDTVVLEQGNFQFSGFISEPSYAQLIDASDKNNKQGFYLENTNQTIVLEAGEFSKAIISSSQTQKEYEKLLAQTQSYLLAWSVLSDSFYKKRDDVEKEKDPAFKKAKEEHLQMLSSQLEQLASQTRRLEKAFIVSHPDSYISSAQLQLQLDFLSLDSIELLYNGLSPKIKSSRAGKYCWQEIVKKQRIKTGTSLSDFSEIDVNGRAFNLADGKGTLVLLDFWASWCTPCIKEMPHLKALYQQFHAKGLEIVMVSLDEEPSDWQKAVIKHELKDWYHIRRTGKAKEIFEPIRFIPAQLLVDGNRKIIWNATDDNTLTLEECIKKYLAGNPK